MPIKIYILNKCNQSKCIEYIEEVLTPGIFTECSGSLFFSFVPNAAEELKQPRKYLTAGNFEVIKDAFISVLCRKFEMAHSLLILAILISQ